nr:leucine-rich repeat extensin-like protein 2 isoform X2 [Procambarus clarkii]
MMSDVEKQNLLLLTTAVKGLGRFLLALSVFLLLILAIICIRKYLNRQRKHVPLPTPPVCHRQLSPHTEYPPTPPINRQLMSVYALYRPTAPDSPFFSAKSAGMSPSPFGSHFSLDTSVTQLSLCRTPPLSPRLLPHQAPGRPIFYLPGSSPRLMPTRATTSSQPGSPLLLPPTTSSSKPARPQHLPLRVSYSQPNTPRHLPDRASVSNPATPRHPPLRATYSQPNILHHPPLRGTISQPNNLHHPPLRGTICQPGGPRHPPLRATVSQPGGQLVRNSWSMPGGLYHFLES